MKSKLPTDWSYPEFYVFAMLYAANADSHITQDEIDVIRPILPDEQYEAVYNSFKACSDIEALEQILSYKEKYFATEEAKKQLIADVVTIFKADKVYSPIEHGFKKIFEKMI